MIVRGRVGRIYAKDLVRAAPRDRPEQRAFDAANAKFYKDVDWAVDISEADAEELYLHGVPADLVRRDPATQIVVTRKAALKNAAWRALDFGRSSFDVGIERMLEAGYPDMVLVTGKRDRNFQDSLRMIGRLREIGVAEAD